MSLFFGSKGEQVHQHRSLCHLNIFIITRTLIHSLGKNAFQNVCTCKISENLNEIYPLFIGAAKLSSECPLERQAAVYLFVKACFAIVFWGVLVVWTFKSTLEKALDNLCVQVYLVLEALFSLCWLFVGKFLNSHLEGNTLKTLALIFKRKSRTTFNVMSLSFTHVVFLINRKLKVVEFYSFI